MEGTTHKLIVPEGEVGRLDAFVAAQLALSRTRAQKLVASGMVLLDGRAAKKSEPVSAGAVVEVRVPPAESVEIEAEDLPLDIVYEDEALLVVNKDSSATTTSAGTMADDTWTTLGFYYSSKDGKFYIYKDNKLVGTSVNTNAPDDEEIALSFTIQNGEAVVKTMSIDYLAVGKERTAVTEL